MRATKIFKNNADIYFKTIYANLFVNYCQFMDILGAMLAIVAHWQIIVQNIAAQI